MSSRKRTKEEILEQAKLNRRKRYEKIKSDPALYAKEKEKEHQRYLRRKEQKKILSIHEMTPRARRQQRKNWRENFKRHYKKKRLQNRSIEVINTKSPCCSTSVDITGDTIKADAKKEHQLQEQRSKNNSQLYTFQAQETLTVAELKKKIRRLRYVMLQNNKAFKCKIKSLEQKVECYKKSMMRLKKRLKSPNSKLNELLKDKSKLPEVKKKILFGEAMKKTLEANYNRQSKTGKKKFSDAVIGDKSILKSHKILSATENFRVRDKKALAEKVDRYEVVKQNVRDFFERDDVSRMTAGKKEVITRYQIQKQKRYLLDSLKNLHKIFEQRYGQVSYSFFCKLRPFWVLIPNVEQRDTCACKIHANIEFLVRALNKRNILSQKTPKDIINSLCCQKIDCLLKRCNECRNNVLNYLEFDNEQVISFKKWVNKKSTYISKGVEKNKRVTEKTDLTMSPKETIEELHKSIDGFLKHEGIRRWQFSALNDLKKNLKYNEVIIHIDFSENYSLKYETEIQSFHFGGSRGELTLHTSIIYLVEAGKCIPKSFCSISENKRHNAAAVWAHIVPILEYIQTLNKMITTLHIISDSPSSQYRNKTIFYIITKLYWYFSTLKQITWNYTAAGHGKGAADGIGGTLKRTADAAVTHGKDVATLESFVNVVTNNTQNIKIVVVDNYQIYEKDLLIPKADVLPLKGTFNVHQVLWHKEKDDLIFRNASCFICMKGKDCPHTKLVGKLKYAKIDNVDNKENNNGCNNFALARSVQPRVIVKPKFSSRNTAPPISETSLRAGRPKVKIQSNILLQPALEDHVEVTRLSDIIPDSKIHLLSPEVDINDMVSKYNVSNISGNFSSCFEDFIRSTSVNHEIQPTCFKDIYETQSSLTMNDTQKPLCINPGIEASRGVHKYKINIENSSEDGSYITKNSSYISLVQNNLYKGLHDGLEPRPFVNWKKDTGIEEENNFERETVLQPLLVKGRSETLLNKTNPNKIAGRNLSWSSSDSDLDIFPKKKISNPH